MTLLYYTVFGGRDSSPFISGCLLSSSSSSVFIPTNLLFSEDSANFFLASLYSTHQNQLHSTNNIACCIAFIKKGSHVDTSVFSKIA